MADHKATLAKARMELEDMYLGVPDDSVNLTFQDLAQVKQLKHTASSEKKKTHPLMNISESTPTRELFPPSNLSKLPSLDFSRGLQEASVHAHHNHHANDHHQAKMFSPMNNYRQHREVADEGMHGNRGHGYNGHGDHGYGYGYGHGHGHGHHGSRHGGMESSMAYDDMSVMSGSSMASMNPFGDRGGRRRPGIPHSNICTICSVYIYMFRTRCLVCGRVYCKECVNIGMGEMTEGRKCVECLGRRFSQRYIQRAGNAGCWSRCFLKYSKWAEKGPRRSGENRNGQTGMMSTSRIPITPRTPTRAQMNNNPPSYIASSPYRTPTRSHMNNNPPSFVANSPYATPSHHHLPL